MADQAALRRPSWGAVTPALGPRPLPTVAILMADSGGGHRAAARSLADAMEGQAHVTLVNLLDEYAPFPFNQLSPTYAPWVNYAPGLYHLVYKAAAARPRVTFAERTLYPLVRRRLEVAFALTRPDLVISVHPLLTGIPLRLLRESGNQAPFVTVVTDPVSVHPAWFTPEVDLCTVATEEARQVALECGLRPERVRVVGLPIRKAFRAMRGLPRPLVRSRLGLSSDRPLVLLSGGGAGIGKVLPMAKKVARSLAQCRVRAQMAIIAGRNTELLRRLRRYPWPIPVTPLGFVENMPEWMAASDLLISKAGPGTIAEAACVGLPVLVTGFIPGQESGNVAWVVRNGAGAFAHQPEQVAELVTQWLQPGNSTLARMAELSLAAARPDAADEIAGLALALYQRRLG